MFISSLFLLFIEEGHTADSKLEYYKDICEKLSRSLSTILGLCSGLNSIDYYEYDF